MIGRPGGVAQPVSQGGPGRAKLGRQGGRGQVARDQDVVGLQALHAIHQLGHALQPKSARPAEQAAMPFPADRLLRSRSGLNVYCQKWMSER